MALIGKIRKNSWLLIILIGLALAAFLLMDMTSGNKSLFGGSSATTLGKINGKKVDVNDLYAAENALYSNSGGDMYARRSTIWDYLVEESIVKDIADKLGLSVSKPEMDELQYGTNLSPIIQARFMDPNTRQVNREQLSSIQQMIQSNQIEEAIQQGQLSPNFPYFWKHQQNEIKKERLQGKFNTLVQKSIYTPGWMAEVAGGFQNQKADFNYVKVPYGEVDDSEVTVSDEDLKAYMNANKALYINDQETRKITYVTFDVNPTKSDSLTAFNLVKELMADFRIAESDSAYIDANGGQIYGTYNKETELLGLPYKDTLFNMGIGDVAGPFLDGKAYTIVKLIDKKIIADSVKSRHILIQAKTQDEYSRAFNTIDSLKNLIDAGTHRFDSLAVKFSQGPSAPKGGDLGYSAMGTMVKPFNDLIFYNAEVGETNIVATQFGVHLVEVQDRKFINNEEGVKIAVISENIVPSEETQDAVYNKTLEFLDKSNNLEELVKNADANSNITLDVSASLTANDYTIGTLPAGQSSRNIVKWAFEGSNDVGDVSPTIYDYQDPVDFYNTKYVVAALKSIQKAGSLNLENVREEILPKVRNEKKAEILKSKIQGQNLGAIASTYGVEVDTVKGQSYSSNSLPSRDNEPKVVATAFKMAPNSTQIVAGENGVYLVQLVFKPEAAPVANIPQLKKTLASGYQFQVSSQLMNAIKKEAKISDNRNTFY